MRTSFSLFAVAALMTMAACSDDDDIGNSNTLAEPQPLVFVATQNALTVETHAATDASWSGGEEIAIKIGNEVKKYKVTSTSGKLESCDANAPFSRSDKSDISVTAWYPYSDSEPAAPTVSTDQSTDQESSKLMKVTATAKYGETTTLAFSHETARISFHLYKEGTGDDMVGATVKVTVTNGSTQTEYTAHDDGDGNYSVLVAPGTTISEGADFLVVNDGSVEPYKVIVPAAVTFLAGTSYEYDFALKQTPYVTFSAESEQGFMMTLPMGTATGLGTFEYSVGDGEWTEVPSEMQFVAFGGSKGNLRLRGISEAGTYSRSSDDNSYSCTISFEKDVPVAASGDIRTLVDYTSYSTASTENARFDGLFSGCASLTSAPELPAMTLADYCYSYMFSDCTSLTSAPELPATTLAEECYSHMFSGCTSLTAAHALPASTLAESCYDNMFSGCTSLTSAPLMFATTLAEECFSNMFSGCTSLTSAPELFATTLADECYYSMFAGCTSLTKAPELPATTLAKGCYGDMFSGCTSLTSAPALSATTLANNCYGYMFSGCTSLTTAPTLPATTLTEGCYSGMFGGCSNLKEVTILAETTVEYALDGWLSDVAPTGVICKKSSLTLPTDDPSGIPSGWSVTVIP